MVRGIIRWIELAEAVVRITERMVAANHLGLELDEVAVVLVEDVVEVRVSQLDESSAFRFAHLLLPAVLEILTVVLSDVDLKPQVGGSHRNHN